MANKARLTETLAFYDEPQLCVAKDAVDTSYLCVLVEQADTLNTYLAVSVSAERVQALRSGGVDVRTILVTPEINEWYKLQFDLGSEEATSPLTEIARGEIPDKWFPAAGFFLEPEPLPVDELQAEAAVSRNAVIRLRLMPPEAAGEPKISSAHLATILQNFQALLKHAYSKATTSMSSEVRRGSGTVYSHVFDVVGFSPGSFVVHLRSRDYADLTNFVEAQRALNKIDELTQFVDDPERSAEVVRRNRGHVANAYLRVLGFITNEQASLEYSWASPSLDHPQQRTISVRQAGPLYAVLSSISDLTTEIVSFVGHLNRADSEKARWRLRLEDSRRTVHGGVKEEAALSLHGLTMGAKYKFTCEERIQMVAGSGRERKLYSLIAVEPV